jgi:Na+-transporting NADH:ubiquinone oxidoreductase subunit NqrC
VCSLVVSISAVALKELQDDNIKLDTQTLILRVAGLIGASDKPGVDEAEKLYT